ncbi:MAG: hypothetical protein M1136_09235 [Chloroflexi bacterium]|nr:hypothetical protein [Chloroflexota bacterium]
MRQTNLVTTILWSVIVIAALVLFSIVAVVRVPEPVKDGRGPLAIKIEPQYTAPDYHNPLDWWKTHHMEVVDRGVFGQNQVDFNLHQCLYCHEVQKSCNNCHSYVGVKLIPEGR